MENEYRNNIDIYPFFETYQPLEPPGSTPRGDRHMRPLTY